jgi:hypothetical protein
VVIKDHKEQRTSGPELDNNQAFIQASSHNQFGRRISPTSKFFIMSAKKTQNDFIEDTASETRNVNEALETTFDGLSQEEYNALEKKRKAPVLKKKKKNSTSSNAVLSGLEDRSSSHHCLVWHFHLQYPRPLQHCECSSWRLTERSQSL